MEINKAAYLQHRLKVQVFQHQSDSYPHNKIDKHIV